MKDEVRWGGVPKGPGGLVDWRSPPGLGVGGEAVVAISAASHCRLRDSQEWECFLIPGPLPLLLLPGNLGFN